MLFIASAFLALARFAAAQDDASPTDIALVQANFNAAQLVPDLLQRFNPEGVLDVSFNGQAIDIGQLVAQADAGSAPSLAIRHGADAPNIGTNQSYTVLMIDADIVGTNARNTELTRHWLVNGARLSDAEPHAITFDDATSVTNYAGPGPAEGSGAHRYTILVYLQPDNFSAPANLSAAGTPLGTMYLDGYVQESDLGDLVAANYFQVENGQATVSVPSTTAVDSATVVAPSASTTSAASGSATSVASQSGAASGAQSGSNAPSGASASGAGASATPSGAASPNREMGWGVAVGAVGIAGAVLGAGMGF